MGSEEASPSWVDRVRVRSLRALREAASPADRLALMRELCRLSGGRFLLPDDIAPR